MVCVQVDENFLVEQVETLQSAATPFDGRLVRSCPPVRRRVILVRRDNRTDAERYEHRRPFPHLLLIRCP